MLGRHSCRSSLSQIRVPESREPGCQDCLPSSLEGSGPEGSQELSRYPASGYHGDRTPPPYRVSSAYRDAPGLAALMLGGSREGLSVGARLRQLELTGNHTDRASWLLPFTLRVWSWIRFPMERGRYVS